MDGRSGSSDTPPIIAPTFGGECRRRERYDGRDERRASPLLTESSPENERPRRTLSLGIRRKPRPGDAADPAAGEQEADAGRRPLFRRKPRPEATPAEQPASPPGADDPAAAEERPTEDSHRDEATAVLATAPKKRSFAIRRKPRPGGAADPAAGTGDGDAGQASSAPEDRPPSPGRLKRERRELLGQRQDSVYHLGGLAFELYRRDMLPGELLSEKALAIASIDARVREIDDRLQQIEDERRLRRDARRRKEDPHAEVGCCLHCRAGFQAGAAYCWQCGAQIDPTAGSSDEDTAVIAAGAP